MASSTKTIWFVVQGQPHGSRFKVKAKGHGRWPSWTIPPISYSCRSHHLGHFPALLDFWRLGLRGCPETSITTNQRCVTSYKREDLKLWRKPDIRHKSMSLYSYLAIQLSLCSLCSHLAIEGKFLAQDGGEWWALPASLGLTAGVGALDEPVAWKEPRFLGWPGITRQANRLRHPIQPNNELKFCGQKSET